jgi:hypothetical protein
MKKLLPTISAMALVGSLAGSASAAGGVLSRQAGSENYCHMKFPAIRPRTLAGNHPQLKSSSTGDLIDFYGPCDESPTGTEQVIEQKHDEELRFDRDSGD